MCYYTTKPLKVTKPTTCDKDSTEWPCNRYLSECSDTIPPICDSTRGDNCVNCGNIGGNKHINLWNSDGSLSGYTSGLDGQLDNGFSCQGGPCRIPGSDTANGKGCGWKVN